MAALTIDRGESSSLSVAEEAVRPKSPMHLMCAFAHVKVTQRLRLFSDKMSGFIQETTMHTIIWSHIEVSVLPSDSQSHRKGSQLCLECIQYTGCWQDANAVPEASQATGHPLLAVAYELV